MALTQITGPYPIFTDLDGTPLDDGYLYIGEANEDPVTNPVQVFFDANLTIPATQPIRTSNGYAYRNGTPALIYTAGAFSITIRNKRDEFVLYSPVGYGFDPAAVSASVVQNDFTGDGVQVSFVLSASPSTKLATSVFINGVYQEKDSYTVAGNTLIFSIAPPLSSTIEVMTNETGVIGSTNATLVSYTAGFAGAILQTVQTKLEQIVSVKDFGAIGDGVTNDTTAIQAAINACAVSGAIVYFPAGTYKVTTLTLPQQGSGIELIGASYCGLNDLTNAVYKGSVILSTDATGNILSCNGGVGVANRGIRISKLGFRVSTNGYAIYLKGAPEGSALRDISIYNVNATGGSAIGLEDSWSGMGVENVHCKAFAKGSGKYGLNIFNSQTAGSYSTNNCGFNGFDYGIKLGLFTYAIKLITTNAESCNYGLWAEDGTSFEADSCHFEFNAFNAIRLKATQTASIQKCTFYNNATDATANSDIYINGLTPSPSYNNNVSIENCVNFGLTTGKTFIYVQFSSYSSGVICNNVITTVLGAGTTGLDIQGTAPENWTVVDNSFGICPTPYAPTSGFKSFSTSFAGYTGIRFASTHVAAANVNTLDDYKEGTWTPVLGGDGGAPTGQVYSTQQGHYQKIGNRVYFSFYVVLTTEGTITGQAAILGLPFTISGTTGTGYGAISEFQNLGLSVVQLSIRPDHTSDKFYFQALTAAAASTSLVSGSTLATNTTAIRGGGMYVTA